MIGVGISIWQSKSGGTVGPVNTAVPVILGIPEVGDELTTTGGTWTGATGGLTYQWMADGVNIGGATSPNYTLLVAQYAKSITIAVTASDLASHTTTATSAAVGPVTDTVAPILSSPTGTKTGTTTASLSVSTDTGIGTLYWVVDTGSTPSAGQVKLGQGSAGSTANGAHGNQAVSATGVQTISGGATGLTSGTTYKVYFMQEDEAANQSTVAASSTFTTDSTDAAATTAFLARTSGLNGTHTQAYKDLINGLVTAGIFAKLDALYVMWTQDSTTAKLNLVGTTYSPITPVSSPVFAADQGYTGNHAGNKYLDAGIDPTTLTQFTQNSAHMGVWVRAAGDNTNGQYHGWLDGVAAGGCYVGISPFGNPSEIQINAAFDSGQVAVSTASTGFILGNRSASNAQQFYFDGASVGSNSTASMAISSGTGCFILARDFGGSPNQVGNEQVGAFTIGSKLTSGEVSTYATLMAAFKTAVGA